MNFKLDDLKPGAQIEMAGWVCATPYGWLTFTTHVPDDYVKIAEHTINVTVPADFNAVAEAVRSIDAAIDTLKDKHHTELRPLMQKKDELLKLTFAGNDVLDPIYEDKTK